MAESVRKKRRVIVCSNCRNRKLKCDREKPACFNCRKSNVSQLCEYSATDTKEPQALSTIEQLKQEIEETKRELMGQPGQDKLINFYQTYNSLTIKNGFVEDNKPFSDMALIQKDVFFRLFFLAVFFTFKPTKELAKEYQKNPGLKAAWRKGLFMDPQIFPKVMKRFSVDDQAKLSSLFDEYAFEREMGAKFKKTFAPGIFGVTSVSENSTENTIGDLICLVESALPPPDAYEEYINFFLENIQPYVQVVNLKMFSEVAGLMQVVDGRFKIVKSDCWRVLILMATILVILRTSYITWGTLEEAEILKKHPICINVITVALKCVGHVNIFKRNNEELLACLIHIALYIEYAAEESDFIHSSSADILLSMISNSGVQMGLFRDPSEYAQFEENAEMQLFRRKLWFTVVLLARFDTHIKGKFPLICKDTIDTLVFKSVKKDDTQSIMQFETEGLKLLSQLDELTFDTCGTCKLSDINMTLKRMEQFLDGECSVYEISPKSSMYSFRKNVAIFRLNMVMRMNLVAVYSSLAVNFEQSKPTGDPIEFKRYYLCMLEQCIDLASNCIRVLDGTYSGCFGHKQVEKFLFVKITHIASVRACYTIFSAILRFSQLIEVARRNGEPSKSKVASMTKLTSVLLELATKIIVQLKLGVSEKQYTSLAMILMLDHCLKNLRLKGFGFVSEFLNWVASEDNPSTMIAGFKNTVRNKMGFEIGGITSESLEERNFLNHLSVEEMDGIVLLAKSKGLKITPESLAVPNLVSDSSPAMKSSTATAEYDLSSGITPFLNGEMELPFQNEDFDLSRSQMSAETDFNFINSFGTDGLENNGLPAFDFDNDLAGLLQRDGSELDFWAELFNNSDSDAII